MAITQVDFKAGGAASPPSATAFNSACAIGDVLTCTVLTTSGSSPGTVTVSDTVNGSYTLLNSCYDSPSGGGIAIFFKVATAVGTPTVSCTESSNQFGQLYIARYNGFVGTPTADATLNASSPFSGATTTVNCTPVNSNFNTELMLTGQVRSAGGYAGATIANWTACDGGTFGSSTYYALVPTSGTNNSFAGTLGTAGAWVSLFAGIYDSVILNNVADGHTASGTTVATGTNGSGMKAVTAGQVIDVLFRTNGTTTHSATCADSLGNTYTQIDHLDNTTAKSQEYYRFYSLVTVPGTPVITCTYGASATLLDVAASVISNLVAPVFILGQVAHAYQTAVSIGASPATDAQSSGNSPGLSTKPVVLQGWGYSDSNGTPAAGSQFTLVGTAWSTLGAGTPRLTYETQTYNATAPVAAKFTPIANQDAYSFLAVFDLNPALAPPSGPMPRQIYIMP